MQITDTIKVGDKVLDSDPRSPREGFLTEIFGTYVSIRWNTGKVTNVNVGRLHRDPQRRSGTFVCPPPAPTGFVLTQDVIGNLRKCLPEDARAVLYVSPKDLGAYNRVNPDRVVLSEDNTVRRQWTDLGIVELRPDQSLPVGSFRFEFQAAVAP